MGMDPQEKHKILMKEMKQSSISFRIKTMNTENILCYMSFDLLGPLFLIKTKLIICVIDALTLNVEDKDNRPKCCHYCKKNSYD